MKFFILFLTYSLSAQAATILTYSYKKAPKGSVKKIDSKEVALAYNVIKKGSFNAPSPKKFFNDYLRFKLGVEMAYYEKKLIKDPKIAEKIASPYLKGGFEQELYKAYAEIKLKGQMKSLDQKTAKLSPKKLQALYSRNPEFNFHYISVKLPLNPSKKQIQEAKNRANKIYAQILNSKKPFQKLVRLYSDEKVLGSMTFNRSQAVIFPKVYAQLKRMNNKKISKPIRVAQGYHIVKLNRKVPFSDSNQLSVKADYFNRERTRLFNNSFNLKRLQAQFKIKYVNRKLTERFDSM